MSQSLFVPRRAALLTGLAGAVAAAPLLTACGGDEDEEEVGPLEDLMREHGVLRRLLVIYGETATRLRSDAASTIDATALRRAAELFRDFGETYHETGLEEPYIFPELRSGGGELAQLADTLQAQHARGREITAYILGASQAGSLTGNAKPLAQALDGFVHMYQAHAAWEDTVAFPAWKEKIGEKRLEELGDRFEQLEQRQFGEDGFETAVKTVAEIEKAMGLGDLATFTAPPPAS